jgi:hypothetical protein
MGGMGTHSAGEITLLLEQTAAAILRRLKSYFSSLTKRHHAPKGPQEPDGKVGKLK